MIAAALDLVAEPTADPAIEGGADRVANDFRLTPREHEVLRLLVDGRSDREIAAALGLKYRTVTSHVTHILTKLEVESRTAAASHAIRNSLV